MSGRSSKMAYPIQSYSRHKLHTLKFLFKKFSCYKKFESRTRPFYTIGIYVLWQKLLSYMELSNEVVKKFVWTPSKNVSK